MTASDGIVVHNSKPIHCLFGCWDSSLSLLLPGNQYNRGSVFSCWFGSLLEDKFRSCLVEWLLGRVQNTHTHTHAPHTFNAVSTFS